MGKTLADGRKKAVSTKTYATGRKDIPTFLLYKQVEEGLQHQLVVNQVRLCMFLII